MVTHRWRGVLGIDFSGLGINQVGSQRPGIAPEKCIGERTVAPEHARQMELHQESGQSPEQVFTVAFHLLVGEQVAERDGMFEITGDEGALIAARGAGVHPTHSLYRWRAQFSELQ